MNYNLRIILGSETDKDVLDKSKCFEILDSLEISYTISILSAHRHEDELKNYVNEVTTIPQIFIAAAGMNAALAGSIATKIVKLEIPNSIVLGVALSSSGSYLDSLLAMTRNPFGVPTGCVGVDTAGFNNAALMAGQIIGMNNIYTAKKLADYLAKNKKLPQPNIIKSDVSAK